MSNIIISIILTIIADVVKVTEDGHVEELAATDEADVVMDLPGAVLKRRGTPMTGGGSGER